MAAAAKPTARAERGALATPSELGDHRANNFDFLRFVLAAAVLFDHCFPMLYGPHGADPLAELVHGQLFPSGAAVDFFFVISGFLVTASWTYSSGVVDYIKRRVLRIYPGFIGASLFCALIAGPLGAQSLSAYFHEIHPIKFALVMATLRGPLLPPVFTHTPLPREIEASFWTIPYEFRCYILVAILGLLGLYRSRAAPLVLFVCLATVYAASCLEPARWLPNPYVRFLGYPHDWVRLASFFLAGMVFYFYRDKIPHSRILLAGSLVLLTGSLLWLREVGPALMPICGSYALLYFAFSRSLRLHGFGRKADLSYGIYVYACPVQQLLVLYFGRHLNWATLFVSAMVLTCALAAASWFAIERPFLRLKKLGSARVPRTAAMED